MAKNALQDPRFTPWRVNDGAWHPGRFGFSFKDGDLRGELQPVNKKGRDYVWEAVLTREGSPDLVIGADDPVKLAAIVLAYTEPGATWAPRTSSRASAWEVAREGERRASTPARWRRGS